MTSIVAGIEDRIRESMQSRGLSDGIDYTLEDGRVVYTEQYLLRRGWCCNHRCRNCPWRAQDDITR